MTMTNAGGLIEAERDALSTLGGELAGIEGRAEAYSATREWASVALARAGLIAACAVAVAVIVAAVLTLENATYAHGGRVPFSFSYRSLYRVKPDPGGYVKVQRRRPAGSLEDSFAVEPLTLPRYSGS